MVLYHKSKLGVAHTIEHVALTQAAAGLLTIKALIAAKVIYLHELVGSIDTGDGTIKVSYDDDGAATNEVDIIEDMGWDVATNCPIPIVSFRKDLSFCPQTIAGKQLTLTTTGGAFKGYAIISYET